jgi:chromosome segregation ATPase
MGDLEEEIKSLHNDIKSLKYESSKGLSNGDRYQMIKLIESKINPLDEKIQLLETEMIRQEGVDNKIYENYQIMLKAMTELRNFKSELQEKIDTENDHSRQYTNEQMKTFITESFEPFKGDVSGLEKKVDELYDEIAKNHDEVEKLDKKIDRHEAQRQIDETKRSKVMEQNEARRQVCESKIMQKIDENENNRKIAEAERFNKTWKILIAIAGLTLTLITLNTYLDPPIHHLLHILFGI